MSVLLTTVEETFGALPDPAAKVADLARASDLGPVRFRQVGKSLVDGADDVEDPLWDGGGGVDDPLRRIDDYNTRG